MEYLELLTNLDLKLSIRTLRSQYPWEGSSSIHWSFVGRRRTQTIFLQSWLLRVLLSLFAFRWASTEKSVRLWESLYKKDSLAVFLLVARVSQLSSCSFLSYLHIHKGCSCMPAQNRAWGFSFANDRLRTLDEEEFKPVNSITLVLLSAHAFLSQRVL